MTPKEIKAGLLTLTDLCCCVNAFEGYFMAYPSKPSKMGDKVYFRQRKALTDCVLKQAQSLFDSKKVHLSQLDKAIHDGGWEDNYFIRDLNSDSLSIHYKD
jgi:hypothetical protein